MIQLPIIGALLEATGMILEKKTLKNKNMNYKNYTVFEFLAIVLMSLPFIYFFWKADAGAFSLKNILIFVFVVVAAIGANLLIFYSMKRKKITEFEPVWLMQPLFTIILAFIIYQSERNWVIVGLALIASLSLVFSHIEKHHLVLDKYIIAAILGSFLFAVELVASKAILVYYSPFTFYFLRCLFVFAICLAIFRPSFRGQGGKTWGIIMLIGLIWVFYRAIIYYGYLSFGIVFTTILFILAPVFLFIFAAVFLKEKPKIKHIISAGIIVLCVIAAILLG